MSSESLLADHEREENSTAGRLNSSENVAYPAIPGPESIDSLQPLQPSKKPYAGRSILVTRVCRAMEARAEHQKIRMYNTIYSFTTAMGSGLICLVLFWLLHYRGGFAWQTDVSKQFNWHPFFMLLGMVFLYSQAILIYRTGRSMPKKKLKLIHAGIHLLAFILSVIGLKAVFDSHNLANPPIPNLYTMHSWIGLLTVIIFSIQFASGFITFLFPGLSPSLRKALMPFHVVFGVSAFVMGLISSLTGLTEKVLWTLRTDYQTFIPEAFVFNFIGLTITFYGLLVLYLATDVTYKRNALPEDEIVLTEHE